MGNLNYKLEYEQLKKEFESFLKDLLEEYYNKHFSEIPYRIKIKLKELGEK